MSKNEKALLGAVLKTLIFFMVSAFVNLFIDVKLLISAPFILGTFIANFGYARWIEPWIVPNA